MLPHGRNLETECRPMQSPSRRPNMVGIVLAAALVLLAFAKARLLRPLNYLWFRFGMLLARVVNPVVMGAVFFLCVTPIALFMRGRNKELLSLRWRRDDNTYWITREPAGPAQIGR